MTEPIDQRWCYECCEKMDLTDTGSCEGCGTDLIEDPQAVLSLKEQRDGRQRRKAARANGPVRIDPPPRGLTHPGAEKQGRPVGLRKPFHERGNLEFFVHRWCDYWLGCSLSRLPGAKARLIVRKGRIILHIPADIAGPGQAEPILAWITKQLRSYHAKPKR